MVAGEQFVGVAGTLGEVVSDNEVAAFYVGDFDGTPDAGFGHVMTAVVQGLGQGDAGGFPATPDAWEEPVFVAVRFPEGAESLEEGGGDGDFAGFAAFAVSDANDESLPFDFFWFEGEGFSESKTGLVDEGEVGPVTTVAESGEKAGNFVPGEDVGEGLLAPTDGLAERDAQAAGVFF